MTQGTDLLLTYKLVSIQAVMPSFLTQGLVTHLYQAHVFLMSRNSITGTVIRLNILKGLPTNMLFVSCGWFKLGTMLADLEQMHCSGFNILSEVIQQRNI